MANLKIEFQKPKLTLCNTNYTPLGILTNKTFASAHNITLTSKVNETPYLTFNMPLGGLIDNNSTELLVKHKNDYFVIKNIQMASGDSNSMVVTAEHIACELKGIVVSYFEDLIGETPENMWNTIVTNSTMPNVINNRYVFETNIVDTYRYLSGEDEKSVFEHLVDIAEQFEACLLFSTDADGIIHIKLHYGDINRGKFIRKGKDLKQLNLTFNTESLFTKITPFGATDDNGIELTIMDLNNGKSYLTNYDYYLAKGMTMEEILANPLCNQECIYRNTDIVDAEDLLRLGQQELKRLSEPIVNGSVEVIDLGVFEGSLYLSPVLCEKIIVIDKDINYSISCKITEIEFTYDNPLESKIGISNVVKYSSALKELIKTNDVIGEILTNGSNGKPNLNASKVKGLIDGHIAQLKYSMENNVTDITDAVVLFENRIEGSSDMFGALAIGSRGVLISRELDPITNQWVWTTALDSHGLSTQIVNAIEINASQIKGDRLSSHDNSTWIDLSNGEFNFKDKIKFIDDEFSISLNNGGTLDDFVSQYEIDKAKTDKEIADLNGALGSMGGTIDSSFKDGIIDEVEMLDIKASLKNLEKEKLDIDARYGNIYNNASLIGSTKTNLKAKYDNFIAKYNNLVSIINTIIRDGLATDEEVAQYETAFNSYKQSIPPLSIALDSATETIANNNAKTQTDAAIEVSRNSIMLSVSETVGSVRDDISENYVTKSLLTQTKSDITAKFSETGGINLIRNGSFWDGLNGWSNWGSPSTREVQTTSLGYRNKLHLVTNGTNQGVTQQISDLQIGTKYTLSAYVYVESGNCVIMVKNNEDYLTTVSSVTGSRQWLELTFTASATSVIVYLGRSVGGSNGTYDFTAVQLERGSIRSSWSPNANEICEGITTINKEGITVSHSNVNTISKMTSEGFYIVDSNGESIASLSSKEQWTELKADKVFANNIENVYLGDANLYVDHSKTEVGDGTSSKPFSCFYELRDYLEKTPIINKDLTINIISTGTISDNLYLRGLKGRGAISININKVATYVDKSNSSSFIHLYDIQNLVTINGGRTGYSTNDGALISGYKYGVSADYCRYVRVEYIAINTKSSVGDQWGVVFNATNGATYRVDFCDSPNAVYADRSSQVYDSDSCGNGTIAFYSARGSSIMFGSSEDNGYRPSGSLKRDGGNIVDLGNREVKTSFRTAPAVPPTVNQYKDFEFSDYGYYSEGYGNWNSIGYKAVYQGDWGYGNNRGVFTLPNSSISSYLSGGTVLDGNQITLQRENAGGYSSSQSIYLWGTTQTTASGSAPPLTKNYGYLGTLAWGEKKTFTLPKAFVTDLKNGTIKSVMFYTSDGSNYIKFSAVCTLRLKVNK